MKKLQLSLKGSSELTEEAKREKLPIQTKTVTFSDIFLIFNIICLFWHRVQHLSKIFYSKVEKQVDESSETESLINSHSNLEKQHHRNTVNAAISTI